MAAAVQTGLFSDEAGTAAQAATGDSLNALMALGQPAWSALRLAISRAPRKGSASETKLKSPAAAVGTR